MLTQWLSPAFPVGAYSYSHGLEWAISAGDITDTTTLKNWLRDILFYGSGRNDAIFLAQAYRAGPGTLAEIADLACAFNPSAERLVETSAQGAAFVKTLKSVWGNEFPPMPYPVALGAAAQAHGLPLKETMHLYLHAFLANLVSAAVRFIPLGQSDGQSVVSELSAMIDPVVADAAEASLDHLGGSALRGDMAAMRHETLPTRIFRT